MWINAINIIWTIHFITNEYKNKIWLLLLLLNKFDRNSHNMFKNKIQLLINKHYKHIFYILLVEQILFKQVNWNYFLSVP